MKRLFSQTFAKEIGIEVLHWWKKTQTLNSYSLVVRWKIARNIHLWSLSTWNAHLELDDLISQMHTSSQTRFQRISSGPCWSAIEILCCHFLLCCFLMKILPSLCCTFLVISLCVRFCHCFRCNRIAALKCENF